ncbi:DUF2177 family protein [Candidatus Nomurabacteria bacterium]|nr:DUF2177 family protein [Candidatus Nomurabacteria bacterium]MCB9819401.1 DUF2177 family protein [Candidatus Nomurabacteria bacterium]
MQIVILTIVGAVLFIILDFIWFYFAGNFFKSEIGSIARLTPEGDWNVRYLPALLAYLLMGVGVSVLVYPHTLGLGTAFLYGALFGLIGYGLYDLTNLATLSDWTVHFVVVDMIWGTLLCGTVSSVIYLIAKAWF